MTTTMAARTTGSWHRHHRHTTGTHGAHAGWEWPWDDEHPFWTVGATGTEHAVVMAERVAMSADRGAGEEDDRNDENNPGDDHHPGRSLVEP